MRLLVSKVIFFFFMFASLELYFVSYSSTPNPFIKSQGRRSMTTLGEPYKPIINKVHGNAIRSRKQASSLMKEFDATGNDDVYNIDYHGVKTHPDPTPKHP